MKNWSWAFNTFCADESRIFASCAARGVVSVYVFDMKGKLVETFQSPQASEDIYACAEMKIVDVMGKKSLLMLFRLPDCQFGVFEIK
jgi:hypothetical protein